MKWGAAPNADIYILEVYSGKKVISENRVKGNEHTLQLEPNRYSYRIRSEDRLKQQGEWSALKDLIVRPPIPEPQPVQTKEILEEIPKTEATFKWKSEDTEHHTIQIWEGSNKILEQSVNAREFTHVFTKGGTYSYSVASVVNQLPSEWSPRTTFNIKISDLPFLKVTSPTEASTNQGPSVTIQWTTTKPVHQYLVKVFRLDEVKRRYEHWADHWANEQQSTFSLFGGRYTVQIIPYGKSKKHRIRTFASSKFTVLSTPMSKTNYSAGIGLSQLSYKETSVSNYSAYVLTAKFGVTYRLSPKFDLGLSTYFTAFTLTSNKPQNSVRFVGINARLGYYVSGLPPDWNLALMFGGYFTTTLVTGNFGFQNLVGPQLTPRLLKRLSVENSIFSYAKFAPVTAGLTLLSLSNREVALGLGWNHSYPSGRSLALTLDVAQLALSFDTVLKKKYVIESQSISVGAGLNW